MIWLINATCWEVTGQLRQARHLIRLIDYPCKWLSEIEGCIRWQYLLNGECTLSDCVCVCVCVCVYVYVCTCANVYISVGVYRSKKDRSREYKNT